VYFLLKPTNLLLVVVVVVVKAVILTDTTNSKSLICWKKINANNTFNWWSTWNCNNV